MGTSFVGRDTELSALERHLATMRAGHGQVLFVTGEPGLGKTELVREFARRALAGDASLITAVGECDALTGQADPYLPFKDILLQLTGDVDDKVAEHVIGTESARRLRNLLTVSGGILVEYGPDLIGIFVPGAGLLKLATTVVSKKLGWTDKLDALLSHREKSESLDQTRLYEQYARVLVKLSEKHPLILVLEDMQWADDSSVELLFHLARRMTDHPIMVVVTYRSADLMPRRGGDRHPLTQLVNEIRRYFGDVIIDLGSENSQQRQEFVDQLVSAEANGLPATFAQTLFQITGGNPLFTEQLLRYAQDTGIVRRDKQGRWVQAAPLTVSNLPAQVDAVIEERLDRLDSNLKEILRCASVIGPTFATEVIARVQHRDDRDLMRNLTQDLVTRYRLLEESGSADLGPLRLYTFRFRHILFQQHLYDALTTFERETLHREVGLALETLYAGRTNDIAAQLALHFSEGHEDAKAIQYLAVAGQRAQQEFSNSAALENYQKLLRILSRQPDTPDVVRRRIAALLALGDVYKHTGSYSDAETAFRDAAQLASTYNEDAELGWALNGLGDVIRFRGDYRESEQIHNESLTIAERLGERRLILEGCNDLASLHFGRAIRFMSDGDVASAGEQVRLVAYYCSRIIALAQTMDDYAALKRVYKTLGNVARLIEDASALALSYYGRSQELAETYGLDLDALCSIGQTYMTLGRYDHAYNDLMRYLRWAQDIGSRRLEVVAHYNLGLLYLKAGEYNVARRALDESLRLNEPLVFRELAVRAWMVKGILADEAGDGNEALELYRKGVLLRTRQSQIDDEAEIWKVAGLELSVSEIQDRALPLLQRYLQLRPAAPDQPKITALMASLQDRITSGQRDVRTGGDDDMTLENDLKVWVKSRVTPFRYQHTLGVHAAVTKLAARYNVDPKPLRLAALLHDSMRDVPVDKMVSLAEEWGLPVRDVDRQSPILLHGALAIEVARREWTITDPVIVSAILYHTAGHKDMSTSDKVFFLADQTERNRTYPRVDEIREAAMRDLDEALLVACEINVAYVTSIHQAADPDTLELIELLRQKAMQPEGSPLRVRTDDLTGR